MQYYSFARSLRNPVQSGLYRAFGIIINSFINRFFNNTVDDRRSEAEKTKLFFSFMFNPYLISPYSRCIINLPSVFIHSQHGFDFIEVPVSRQMP